MSKQHKEEEKPTLLHEILSWIMCFVMVIVMTYLIITFVGQRTMVIGSSMYPTLENGDNLIVEKLSYRFGDPERFDIIVFPYAQEPSKHYIKRIIGLPGETVQIEGDNIYIDGTLLEESYGAEPMQYEGAAAEPITLGPDEYFVLGDNRNHSSDSRAEDVGMIRRKNITGKAWVRIYPFNKAEVLNHGND